MLVTLSMMYCNTTSPESSRHFDFFCRCVWKWHHTHTSTSCWCLPDFGWYWRAAVPPWSSSCVVWYLSWSVCLKAATAHCGTDSMLSTQFQVLHDTKVFLTWRATFKYYYWAFSMMVIIIIIMLINSCHLMKNIEEWVGVMLKSQLNLK